MSSRNHIKTQKSTIFIKKNLKIKSIVKLETIVIIQENIELQHIVYVM